MRAGESFAEFPTERTKRASAAETGTPRTAPEVLPQAVRDHYPARSPLRHPERSRSPTGKRHSRLDLAGDVPSRRRALIARSVHFESKNQYALREPPSEMGNMPQAARSKESVCTKNSLLFLSVLLFEIDIAFFVHAGSFRHFASKMPPPSRREAPIVSLRVCKKADTLLLW